MEKESKLMPTYKETATMTIDRYRDKNGNPTCAINFETGDVCVFYATQKFGCTATCWFADQCSNKKWQLILRRDNGNGSLIPLADCPIWRDKNE